MRDKHINRSHSNFRIFVYREAEATRAAALIKPPSPCPTPTSPRVNITAPLPSTPVARDASVTKESPALASRTPTPEPAPVSPCSTEEINDKADEPAKPPTRKSHPPC